MSFKNTFSFRKKFITDISFLDCGDKIKLVIRVRRPAFDAELAAPLKKYADSFNDEEPYDRKTHVFFIDKDGVDKNTKLCFAFRPFIKKMPVCRYRFLFGEPEYADEKALIAQYDNGLKESSRESETLGSGVTYSHILYNDKNGAPVHAFLCEFDPKLASVYIGTPDDGYESVKVRATIPEMIDSANRNGKKVIAAVNADFFDMFGDYHPSGLCVKNGRVVANENSERPFIGVKQDGTHILSDIRASKDIMSQLSQAAAGKYTVLRNGEISEYAPLEPFSFVRHPRTCVGIKPDGKVLILVVDGRIPEYSNGASLVDLVRLMQSYGAESALNLDGGGSSAMYTRNGGEYILRSRPADLFRPTAKLIRKDYNALLIVEKE